MKPFKKQIEILINGFPDMQWSLKDVVAEGDKVFVTQTVQGTHTNPFQNFEPTQRSVTIEGVGFYTFEDGKIVAHQIFTDRLGFLQQLGLVDEDFIKK